jgi:exopolysaccharide biosynthesis polyprenyl glycosylphosphotransferase
MSNSALPQPNGVPDKHYVKFSDDELDSEILAQGPFLRMLRLEHKRTERSRRSFVLMLLESCGLLNDDGRALKQVLEALLRSTRATDIKGWYENKAIIGVIFTEVGTADSKSIAAALLSKVTNALSTSLNIEQINEMKLSFHVFPETSDEQGKKTPLNSILYSDAVRNVQPRTGSRVAKRGMDIAGSLCALLVLSPVFLVIALLIKATSRGPVLFRQERLGQFGKRFTFLKFRSMYPSSDHTVHKEFVQRFIAGEGGSPQGTDSKPEIYKITQDSRITPIGGFLRRTSLDELPQFINVLTGEMSLVGPRPPIPYEAECYDLWHRRRLLEVKPGITGLWQVKGRSRTKFDEMVRLDLEYANTWSFWLDLKILFQTPKAVFSGEGAY